MDHEIVPFDRRAMQDERQGRALDVYRRARIAVEYKRVFGRSIDLLPSDAPDVAVLRQQMVDTFNEYRPPEGWAYPDGAVIGDWRRLPDDPEKLAAWVDDAVSEKLAEIARGVRR